MKTNEEHMTPTEAAGYIAGIAFCFVRRYYRMFSILTGLAGLGLFLAGVRYLHIGTTGFELRLGESVWIGGMLIATSIALWFGCHRSSR